MNKLLIVSYFFKSAFRSMKNEWKISLLTIFSIMVIGFLFFSIFITLKQVKGAFYRYGEQTNLIVFLEPTSELEVKDKVLNEVCKVYGIQSCTYRSQDVAETIFIKDYPELEGVVGQLRESPFLGSVQIFFDASEDQMKIVNSTAQILKKIKGIASVENIPTQIFMWSRYFGVFQKFFWIFGVIVGLSTLYLLFGAISMTVHRHRIEIEILSLVGAKTFLIALPYVVQGVVQTLVGVVAALGIVYGVSLQFNEIVEREFGAYFLSNVHGLLWLEVGIILLVSTVLAGTGSYLAVRRYLKNT